MRPSPVNVLRVHFIVQSEYDYNNNIYVITLIISYQRVSIRYYMCIKLLLVRREVIFARAMARGTCTYLRVRFAKYFSFLGEFDL